MADPSVNIVLKAIDKASKPLNDLKGNLTDFGKVASKVGMAIGAATGVVVAGFAAMAVRAVQSVNDIRIAAEQVGVSVDFLSGLKFAAAVDGVNFDQLRDSFKDFSKILVEAQDPASRAGKAFKAFGIDTLDASGNIRKSEDVFNDLADQFAQMPDGPTKAATAMALFGESGLRLIPILNRGSEGIKKNREEAERLGVVIDETTATSAKEFNDSIVRIQNSTTGLFLGIAKELLPTLNALAAQVVDVVKNSQGFKSFISGFGMLFRGAVIAVKGLTTALYVMGTGLGAVAAAIALVTKGEFTAAKNVLGAWVEDTKEANESHKKFVASIESGIPPQAEANKLTSVNTELQKKLTAALVNKTKADKAAEDALKARIAEAKRLGEQTEKEMDLEEALRVKKEEAIKKVREETEEIEFQNSIMMLSNKERERAILLRQLEAAGVDTTAESVKNWIEQQLRIREVAAETEIYRKTVGSLVDKTTEWTKTIELLDKWMFDGKITLEQYDAAMKQFLKLDTKPAEQSVSQLDEFVKAAAQSMQNSMSDFFFNFMQGQLTDFVGGFKAAIDRIVADMLAAQAATALFGDYAKGKGVGGLVGQLGGFLSGMFRAEGGGVKKNSPYIVGEKGPELMVPSVNGTILPNSALQSMVQPQQPANINIEIKALDSQDVIRALDKIKRPIAEMINGTTRTYNLRGI